MDEQHVAALSRGSSGLALRDLLAPTPPTSLRHASLRDGPRTRRTHVLSQLKQQQQPQQQKPQQQQQHEQQQQQQWQQQQQRAAQTKGGMDLSCQQEPRAFALPLSSRIQQGSKNGVWNISGPFQKNDRMEVTRGDESMASCK